MIRTQSTITAYHMYSAQKAENAQIPNRKDTLCTLSSSINKAIINLEQCQKLKVHM